MNPLKYILATSVLIPAVGILLTKWRARVELDSKKEAQGLVTENLPVLLLKEELARTRAELAEVRADDREERKRHAQDMTAIGENMIAVRRAIEEIAADFRGQREEARGHAARVHQRIDTLDNRLLVIETQLDVKKRQG